MWSCVFDENHPVQLVFKIPCVSGIPADQTVSKVHVWNYNRSLKVGV